MLPKSNRLHDKTLFQAVFAQGKRVFFDGVGCFSLPTKDDILVVGVTFSQKAFPKAVTRHRYKRLTLHIIRQILPTLPKKKALVVHFQKPMSPLTLPRLRATLTHLLAKLLQ